MKFCWCARTPLIRTYTERANVLQTSTITEQTFEWPAIAAKLIRWYIRTWLSDTVLLEFSFLRGANRVERGRLAGWMPSLFLYFEVSETVIDPGV